MKPTHTFVVAPSCAGKTTFKRAHPEVVADTDDAKDPALEPELKQLRRAALIDPLKWADHNKVWHAQIDKMSDVLLQKPIVIGHSMDDLSVVAKHVGAGRFVAVIPPLEQYSEQVARRLKAGTATLPLVTSSYKTALRDVHLHGLAVYPDFATMYEASR